MISLNVYCKYHLLRIFKNIIILIIRIFFKHRFFFHSRNTSCSTKILGYYSTSLMPVNAVTIIIHFAVYLTLVFLKFGNKFRFPIENKETNVSQFYYWNSACLTPVIPNDFARHLYNLFRGVSNI